LAQTTEDAKTIKDNLDKLQGVLESADENGLFKNNSDTYKEIVNGITAALEELDQEKPRTIEAWKKFTLACHQLNQIINSSSFWWRFKYSFGAPFLLFFVTILICIFLGWIFFSPIILDSKMLWVPSWAYLWGSMGGVLQGFWWLWQHVSDRILRKHWLTWYLLLPLMGAILGALAYLIFFAGFIASTGEAQITSEFFPMLLSALAGFSSRWAVQMLDKLTTMIQIRG